MRLNEQIALVASETGWALEYIRELPLIQLDALTVEFLWLRNQARYASAYNAALIVCTLASTKTHRYRPTDIIGYPPERRVMTDQNNLAKPAAAQTITLANGKEYELAPITANIYAELEDKFGKSTDELFDGKIRFKVYTALIYARLRKRYPELTEEQVGELLTTDVIVQAREVIK